MITDRTETGTADAHPADPPSSSTKVSGRRAPGLGLSTLLERFGLLGLWILLIVVFALALPTTFLTGGNLRAVTMSQSVLAVMAVALIFPLVGGRFDISVGANAGLCSIVTATAMSRFGLSLPVAILLGVIVGMLVGAFNGVLVAYFGINSIIATIGVSTVITGIIQAYTQGIPISSGLSPVITTLSSRLILGVPALFVIMIVLAAVAWFILTQSAYGRFLAAVGSNENAAVLTGLPVRRIITGSFIMSGAFAGLAGVMQVAAQGNGNPQVGGITFMLPALAAVFLGATTFRPGTYNVPGTVLGLFFIGTAVSGLSLLGAQTWVTDVFNGTAVIVAVGLSAHFRRRRTGTSMLGE
jgi:ribose transport system permease protein